MSHLISPSLSILIFKVGVMLARTSVFWPGLNRVARVHRHHGIAAVFMTEPPPCPVPCLA